MMKDTINRKEAIDAFSKAVHVLGVLDAEDIKTVFRMLSSEQTERLTDMKKVQVLEKVKAFPFDGYRKLTSYNNVICITAEYYDETEYFCLHLENGLTATYNTVDYIMEFV